MYLGLHVVAPKLLEVYTYSARNCKQPPSAKHARFKWRLFAFENWGLGVLKVSYT
jgi:hypothetical protein